MEFVRAGFRVLGFDVSKGAVEGLNAGRSHVQDVPSADLAAFVKAGKFSATGQTPRLQEPDVVDLRADSAFQDQRRMSVTCSPPQTR